MGRVLNTDPKLKLSPHFERVPGSGRHAFVRSRPDRVFALTDDTFALLQAFSTAKALVEVLPNASVEQREVVAMLVELGVLLQAEQAPAPYVWAPPRDPIFGLSLWPNVSRGERRPIVVLGARYDDATLSVYPRGARDGPAALRAASLSFPLVPNAAGVVGGFPRVELDDRVLAGVAMADGGDLVPDPTCPWSAFAEGLEQRMELLGATASCLLLGGDHSVSLPAIRALGRRHQRIGVLHFDAHGDFGVDVGPVTVTHANVMRHVFALPHVTRLVQVGVRGIQSLPSQREDYHRFTPQDLRRDLERVVASLDADLPWYVSVDIDVLDPSVAPGTGALEPGGLSFAELCEAIRACTANRQIIGADLVEVQQVPGDRLTGRVGAHILIELAAAIDHE